VITHSGKGKNNDRDGLKTFVRIALIVVPALVIVFSVCWGVHCFQKQSNETGESLFELFLATGDILSFIGAVIFGVKMYRLEQKRDAVALEEIKALKVRARQIFDFRYIELTYDEQNMTQRNSASNFEALLKKRGIFHYLVRGDNFHSVELPRYEKASFYFWVLRLSGEGFVFNCNVTLLDKTLTPTEVVPIGLMSSGQVCIIHLPDKMADECSFIIEYDTIEHETIQERIEFRDGLKNSFAKDDIKYRDADASESDYCPWIESKVGRIFSLDPSEDEINKFANKT